MLHSGIAKLKCSDCQRYNYRIPEGTLETYETDQGHLPVLREPDMPPPCDQCPRGGPQNEQLLKLSERNWKAYSLYLRIKACQGMFRIHPLIASCPIFADNMRIIDDTIEHVKREMVERAREKAERESGNS